jgi:hypothetical protein
VDRSGSRGIVLGALLWLLLGGLAAAAPPPAEEVDDGVPGLVEVPAGCPEAERADVAFVGTVVDKDYRTVRYEIDQIRARTAAPWAIDGLIDVRYGSDAKFLDEGGQYLVGASVDPSIGVLASTVRPPEPLFGGNDVIGLNDTALECREIEGGVRTLHVDGTTVDSGVLSPLVDEKVTVLATIAIPTAIAFGVLLALVLLRIAWRWATRGVFELGRAAVTPAPDHRAIRVRSHQAADERPQTRKATSTK